MDQVRGHHLLRRAVEPVVARHQAGPALDRSGNKEGVVDRAGSALRSLSIDR